MGGKYRIRLKGEILMKWDRGETLSGLLIGRKSQYRGRDSENTGRRIGVASS